MPKALAISHAYWVPTHPKNEMIGFLVLWSFLHLNNSMNRLEHSLIHHIYKSKWNFLNNHLKLHMEIVSWRRICHSYIRELQFPKHSSQIPHGNCLLKKDASLLYKSWLYLQDWKMFLLFPPSITYYSHLVQRWKQSNMELTLK